MTKTSEIIIAGLVTKIEDLILKESLDNDLLLKIELILKEANLNKDQYENIRLNFRDLNDIWQLEDIKKFISDLHVFMLDNLQTGDFNTWRDAFQILSQNNYQRDLKGFLTSIEKSKDRNLDFSDIKPFEWFLMNFSGLKYQKTQPVFQAK